MAFYTSLNGTNTEAMRIDSSQNVGIGTGAAGDGIAANLHIVDPGTTSTRGGNILIGDGVSSGDESIELQYDMDNSNMFTLSTWNGTTETIVFNTYVGGNKLMVGPTTTGADGNLHVHSASAGSVAANADADELVVEGSANSGISILSGNDDIGGILFGDDGDNDIGRIQYHHSSNQLGIVANATGTTFFNSGPMVGINESSNGYMAQGITINQGANTNELFALKSSTIDHGITNFAEADTFLLMKKGDVGGGADIYAFEGKDGSSNGYGALTCRLAHYAGLITTKSTSGYGSFRVTAATRTGTSWTTLNGDANIASFENNSQVKWIIDEDGDVHYDGTTNASAWDDHDDVALLDSFRALTAPDTPDMRQVFGDVVQEHAQVLNDTGVITLNDDGHHFVSTKGLNGLLIDSIRQVHSRAEERDQKLLEAIDQRDTKIALLEQRLNRLEN